MSRVPDVNRDPRPRTADPAAERRLEEVFARLKKLFDTLTLLETRTGQVEAAVQALGAEVHELAGTVQGVLGREQDRDTLLSGLEERLTAAESGIADLVARVPALEEQASDHEERLAALEEQASGGEQIVSSPQGSDDLYITAGTYRSIVGKRYHESAEPFVEYDVDVTFTAPFLASPHVQVTVQEYGPSSPLPDHTWSASIRSLSVWGFGARIQCSEPQSAVRLHFRAEGVLA